MYDITLMIDDKVDWAACMVETLDEFGSLRASRTTWARILRAAGFQTGPHYAIADGVQVGSPEEEIQRLINRAVPKPGNFEEGEYHPQRAAGRWNSGFEQIELETPGGVCITLMLVEEKLAFNVNFGSRDSEYAAFRVLAGLQRRNSRHPELRKLLVEWANELTINEQ